jgi:hypothetical protein
MPTTVRRLTTSDFDQMYSIYAEHLSFQGVHKDAMFYLHPEIDQHWQDYYKNALSDTTNNYSYGSFDNSSGNLLAFVNTHIWTDGSAQVWNMDRLTATKTVPLSKGHGGKFWPDCLIGCVNTATLNYEGMGITTAYTLRTAINPKWIPITSVPNCRLFHYTSNIVATIKGGYPPDDQKYFENVCLNGIFAIDQYIVQLTKR